MSKLVVFVFENSIVKNKKVKIELNRKLLKVNNLTYVGNLDTKILKSYIELIKTQNASCNIFFENKRKIQGYEIVSINCKKIRIVNINGIKFLSKTRCSVL